ncbi:DNA-3-methyladenine glycosylase [Bacillus gobiensis]|uniref:DNA-3-methyladenine glycosylase family protein n=1 Tax=Bacillus gobiensis TaxID=1441095 RepID=UPI003D216BCE
MWMETIDVTAPYHFKRILERLTSDPLNVIDLDNRSISLPLRNKDQEPSVVLVKAIGTIEQPVFQVSGKDEADKDDLLKEVKRIFQWETNLLPVMEHFKLSNLAAIFEEHTGTPLVLDFNLYHCLVKCMIHQQLNLSFAHKLTARFVQTFGEQKEGVWFYPLPETIAGLDYSQLRELQFSMRKAEYVIDTSRMIASGELQLEELPSLSDEEIMEKLVKIRGIGPWTVQNVLLFGLGRPNLFPLADIGIQNALKKHFGLEKKPTKEEMLEWSKEWHPFLSYASLYLWRSIE